MLAALASALVAMSGTGAVAAIPRTEGGWSVQSVPSPAGATSVSLNGISCPSAELCIAVGGSSLGTLAEKWNGTAWSIQTTRSRAAGDVLNSVSCVARTACEAVGGSGKGAVAEAWNGRKWTGQATPRSSGASFASVWCASASNCVAVGANNSGPIAAGWNGKRWKLQPGLPKHRVGDSLPVALTGVWCGSTRSCTAVGYAFDIPGPHLFAIATWNGKTWTWTVPGYGGALSGISCSKRVCMAVGYTGAPIPEPGVPGPVSLENPASDGGTRELAPSPKGASYGMLNSVSCRWTMCEAVGGTSLGVLATRWNGTKWLLQDALDPEPDSGALSGIACTTTSACIAVGSASGAPLAEAYVR